MQVSRNETLIKRRSRLGTYATFAGLGVLVAGMVVSFRAQYLWVSMIALLVGFVLSQYGNYNLRRWGHAPRPDQMIENTLKGFDDRYHFYAWELPVPYALLTPQGIYAFITRDQTGKVTNNGAQWRGKMTLGKALTIFAQEGLGNPTSEATDTAARLEKWIKTSLPDLDVTVKPAIIWISERVELDLNDPTVPVLEAKSLKKWLRGGKGTNMKTADYRAVEELFDSRTTA